MSTVKFYFLGLPTIEHQGQIVSLERRKATALLAYLALSEGPQPRDVVATLLWPELSQSRARGALRRTLLTIRTALGRGWLQFEGDTFALAKDETLWVDVSQFQAQAARLRSQREEVVKLASSPLTLLSDTIALYRGDFLAGFTLRDSAPFDEWQTFQTENLRRTYASLLEMLIKLQTDCGAYEAAIPYARRWLALDPLHEAAHRALMRLYAGIGQHSAAMRQYQECLRTLQEEFDAPPAAETEALYEQIRQRKAGNDGKMIASPPRPVNPSPPHNLPAQPTSFIGRERELAQIAELLAQPHCRLLTVVGPGGVGKTRLALQAATARLSDFVDGVFVVFLAAIREPAFVISAIAQTLDVRQSGSRPLQEMIKATLRDRQLLIVLDNFEHVTEAAPVISELLAACPHVKVLVTSRTSLHLRGEHEYLTPPLPVPDPVTTVSQSPFSYASLELFRQRAQAVRHDFVLNQENVQAVAAICARLDGLPLAIELAAARIRLFSPQALLNRLASASIDSPLQFLKVETRDAPARHRSLWDAISWSYHLLDVAEQMVFRQLSVFVGGCTLGAVETVGNQGLSLSTLDGLSSLVDKSLVQRQEQPDGEPRFLILETVREFGLELLRQHNELAVTQQRHAHYYRDLTAALAPQLHGPHSVQALATLRSEFTNIRTALRWSLTQRDVHTCMKLCDVLLNLWTLGYLHEADTHLREALALAEGSPPSVGWVHALANAGYVAYCLGDPHRARPHLERSLAMNQAIGNLASPASVGMAKGILAWILFDQGEYENPQAYLEESLIDAQTRGDPWAAAMALINIGHMATRLGDTARAGRFLVEGLASHRAIGQKWGISGALYFLGYWCVQEGRFGQARSVLAECLALAEEIQANARQAQAKRTLAWLEFEEGNYAQASALFKESLIRWQHEGRQRDIIETLEPMIRLVLVLGQPRHALTLAGATAAHRRKLGLVLPPPAKTLLDQAVAAARQSLTKDIAYADWAAGEAMTLDEAVAQALVA